MIERLEGEFLEIGAGHVLIGIGGVGIRVSVPRTVVDRLAGSNRGVLWTRMLVRDSDPQLYGFPDPEQRACFDALIGVNGVGPRIALAILSSMEPAALAIEADRGSLDQLLLVSGVGRKLAARIVLELKGKLPVGSPAADAPGGDGAGSPDGLGADAVRALTSLGYPAAESREIVQRLMRQHGKTPPALDELLRQASWGSTDPRPRPPLPRRLPFQTTSSREARAASS